MIWFAFVWWLINPSVNIRVYVRLMRGPIIVPRYTVMLLNECFSRCTDWERRFILRFCLPEQIEGAR